MGEYYTPRWLAQAITKELVTDPVNTRVLDPACGSGTFLEAAARHLIAHSGRLTPGEQLARLQENIVGIDLHPVAVQLAKASWVIACQDVIKAARKAVTPMPSPLQCIWATRCNCATTTGRWTRRAT